MHIDKRRRRGLAVIAGSVLIATPAGAAGPLGPGGPAPMPAAPAPVPKAVTPLQAPMAAPTPTNPRGVLFENKTTGDTGVTESDANDISGTIVGAPSYSATPSGEAKTFTPTVDKRDTPTGVTQTVVQPNGLSTGPGGTTTSVGSGGTQALQTAPGSKQFNPTVDKRGDARSDITGGTLIILSGGTATNTLATPKQFNPTIDKRAGSATDGAQPNAIGTTITLDRGATHTGGALSVSSGGTATSTYAPASKQFNPTVDKRGGSTTGGTQSNALSAGPGGVIASGGTEILQTAPAKKDFTPTIDKRSGSATSGTQPGANAFIVSSGGTATSTFRADKSFDPTIDKRADTDNR
jgi:hypothetical protein